MTEKEIISNYQKVVSSSNVGSAVGVSKKKWYVAIVKNNTEKKSALILGNIGYEVFVPTQKEERIDKNGNVRSIDKVLLPSRLLIRCTETERMMIVQMSFITRFMMDSMLNDKGKHILAVIPDKQVEEFKKVVKESEEPIDIISKPVCLGEKVKIFRGRLKGLIGNVLGVCAGGGEDSSCYLYRSVRVRKNTC